MATSYFIEEFDKTSQGWQGYNYYKFTDGISQGRFDGTSILMTISKTINPNGTLYYGINWMNQVYNGVEDAWSGPYYENIYSSKVRKLRDLPSSDGFTFTSTYNAIYDYIYSQVGALINSETATLYSYTPTPTYMLTGQPFWYLSNSKSNGSMIQVTWDGRKNGNLINLSLVVGSYDQSSTNPIKKSFEWYNSKLMDTYFDPYYMFGQVERFASTLKESKDPYNDLYPIYPTDGFGIAIGDIARE